LFIQTALEIWHLAKVVGWSRCSVMETLEQRSPERQHPVGEKTTKLPPPSPNHNKIFKSSVNH